MGKKKALPRISLISRMGERGATGRGLFEQEVAEIAELAFS